MRVKSYKPKQIYLLGYCRYTIFPLPYRLTCFSFRYLHYTWMLVIKFYNSENWSKRKQEQALNAQQPGCRKVISSKFILMAGLSAGFYSRSLQTVRQTDSRSLGRLLKYKAPGFSAGCVVTKRNLTLLTSCLHGSLLIMPPRSSQPCGPLRHTSGGWPRDLTPYRRRSCQQAGAGLSKHSTKAAKTSCCFTWYQRVRGLNAGFYLISHANWKHDSAANCGKWVQGVAPPVLRQLEIVRGLWRLYCSARSTLTFDQGIYRINGISLEFSTLLIVHHLEQEQSHSTLKKASNKIDLELQENISRHQNTWTRDCTMRGWHHPFCSGFLGIWRVLCAELIWKKNLCFLLCNSNSNSNSMSAWRWSSSQQLAASLAVT